MKQLYFKYKNDWVYIVSCDRIRETLPDLLTSYLCVVTRTFNPEKFFAMAACLLPKYEKDGSPTKILEGFLSIHTTGKYGSFDSRDSSYSDPSAPLKFSVLHDIVSMLGLQCVVLWNAVLLKKRILVIGDTLPLVMKVVRTLPLLCWHRQDWNILRPVVRSDADQLSDLSNSGVFIAGTLDTTLEMKSDIYDVVFSLSEKRVTVAPHALDKMRMTGIHREVANMLVELSSGSDNGETMEKNLLKSITKKTKDIIDQLMTFASDGKVTEEAINANVNNPLTQQWLLRLAIAEDIAS